MIQTHLKIATRKSPLAMQQAMSVRDVLLKHYSDLSIELLPMETTGDTMLSGSLNEIGGKGLFVKELERALLEKRADLAVHSMKDVPTVQPEGLELAVVCKREDPRDVFISTRYQHMMDLPPGATIGTASLRRQCQLYGLSTTVNVQLLRGNINTRLKRLKDGDFDAIVLAAAGLKRLNLESHIQHYFSTSEMIPSAGQGALGIECRRDDEALKKRLAVLSDPVTKACLQAERALTHRLGGNCRAPVAAFCERQGEEGLLLRGLVGSPKGEILLSCDKQGELVSPEALGIRVAEALLEQGAGKILAALGL